MSETLLVRRALVFYYLCRFFQIFPVQYNKKTQRLQLLKQTRTARYWRRVKWLLFVALAVKCFKFTLIYIEIGLLLKVWQFEKHIAQVAAISTVVIATRFWTVCQVWGMQRHCNNNGAAVVTLVNAVLRLRRRVQHMTQSALHIPPACVRWLHVKQLLLLLHVALLLSRWAFELTSLNLCYVLAFELCYYAYQTLQLTLLCVQQRLNAQLQHVLRTPDSRCLHVQKCYMRTLRLQHCANKLHATFTGFLHWMPLATYLCIASCIQNLYMTISIVGYTSSRTKVKLWSIGGKYLSEMLLTCLNIFLMAMLNDAFEQERQLSRDLAAIGGLRCANKLAQCQTCHRLEQVLEMEVLRKGLFRNDVRMFKTIALNGKIVLSFILDSFIYALSCIMYDIELGFLKIQK